MFSDWLALLLLTQNARLFRVRRVPDVARATQNLPCCSEMLDAMVANPMVGYWCRVVSLALTHTRTDIFGAVAIWDQRTMLSIFVVPPTARLHQGCWLARIGRCSSGSAGRVWSLGPKSSPGALHHWFVCLQRMHACHVLYWAAVSSLGRGPVARCLLYFSTRSLRWHQGCILSPAPALAPSRSHVLAISQIIWVSGPRCLSGMFSTLFDRR